ncbi:MAG: hypothetical protein Q9201_004926 [Fulgogasparrea decipioides]
MNQVVYSSTFSITPQDRVLPPSKATRNVTRGYTSESSFGLSTTIENEVLSKAKALVESSTVPDAAVVEDSLQACEVFAKLLADDTQSISQDIKVETTPASDLLSLEESQDGLKAQRRKDVPLTEPAKNAAAQLISSTAYRIITDPKVYITPKLLSMYVNVQSLLGRPRSLPEVFRLYASKLVPKPGSNPITFSTPNPNKPSAQIPLQIANTALTAGIKVKDLPLCFDIIENSVCAPAFRISKFFRKAFIPISGAVLAPFAVHKLASELSVYQSTMDSTMATNILFGGILAYVGFTATIGYVAVTTSNDQMDRVTWASGTPLHERWMREEERMLIDRVAGAWGFQQRSKRGEETGPDWEGLRELVGLRRMILDRTELMDGME